MNIVYIIYIALTDICNNNFQYLTLRICTALSHISVYYTESGASAITASTSGKYSRARYLILDFGSFSIGRCRWHTSRYENAATLPHSGALILCSWGPVRVSVAIVFSDWAALACT